MRTRRRPSSREQLPFDYYAPPPLVLDALLPPPPQYGPDSLAVAFARHEAIEAALRAGGPNPLPEELSPDEWEEQLAAYHDGGPGDCPLLRDAETAAEKVVEMLPDHWAEPDAPAPPAPAPLDAATQAACLRIYWESRPDLAEEQLHADLLAVTEAGHADVAGLIGEELKRREQEAPYPFSCAAWGRGPVRQPHFACHSRSSSSCRNGPKSKWERPFSDCRSGFQSATAGPADSVSAYDRAHPRRLQQRRLPQLGRGRLRELADASRREALAPPSYGRYGGDSEPSVR